VTATSTALSLKAIAVTGAANQYIRSYASHDGCTVRLSNHEASATTSRAMRVMPRARSVSASSSNAPSGEA